MMCFHHHQQTYFWFIVFKLWLPKYRLSRLKKTFPIFLTFVCLSIILVQPKLGLFWGFALFWLSHSRHTKYYCYCYILSHFTIDHGRGTFTFTFTCTWVNLVAPLFLISTKTMLTPLFPFCEQQFLVRIETHPTTPYSAIHIGRYVWRASSSSSKVVVVVLMMRCRTSDAACFSPPD